MIWRSYLAFPSRLFRRSKTIGLVSVWNAQKFSPGHSDAILQFLCFQDGKLTASSQPNRSFHPTKPLVTHLADARSAPIVFAGETNVMAKNR